VTIVEEPPAFPPRDYDGLSVGREELPPLLTPGMLMDLEGYAAWERHMVERCADLTRTPESVLATLKRDARTLGAWRPGSGSLSDAVASLPAGFVDAAAPVSLESSMRLHAEVMRAVPDELKPDPGTPQSDDRGLEDAFVGLVRPMWESFRAPLDRYLAGKAFASWTAYQGRGVATIVHGLEAALALVRVEAARQCRDVGRPLDAALLLEAFREADFILNHLAIGEDLAAAWSSAEGDLPDGGSKDPPLRT